MRLAHALCGGVLLVTTAIARGQGEDEVQRQYTAAQQTLAAGDAEGALRQFQAIAERAPKVAEVHATIGALLFQRGSFRAAEAELEKARALKPGLANVDGLVAMCEAELGESAKAIPELERTFHTAKDAPVERMSGLELERAYTAMGKDREAVALALELDRMFPEDAEVLYRGERIFGNYAYLTVERLARVAPESVWRHLAAAEALESQGSHDAAIAEYGEVLRLDPRHPGTHYRLGRVLRERARDLHHPEDLAAARKEFAAELQLDPENANAVYELGELDRLEGDLASARKNFEAALRLYPEFPEANLGMGTVLSAQHEWVAALPYLRKATADDPTDEASWYRLAMAERALGHAAEQKMAMARFLDLHGRGAAALAVSARDVSRQQLPPEAQTTP